MRVPGSTVLLTGATGGIGHTLAHALAGRGARVIATGRRPEALEPLAALPGARAIAADLADPADLARLVEEAGPVDILVANAALPSSGELLDYTEEQIDRALDVNLRAPVLLARLLTPAMVAAGRGHLAMIGSISGRTASPGASLYNATKFGLRGFSLSLRQDLHGTGVGVSLIQPGFVREAGMFAATGATVTGARTVSPRRVADQVLAAIERNRAEVNVAPLELRLASALGSLFPSLAAATQRSASARKTMRHVIAAQRDRR
ncbi:SDR family NAD(P)-dependent oxidoreductase [Kitasatospora sp. NPDC052896]|uniref:SDR family NAD(P)-dependent oxidoreductase n=1 Tax=Kitasatospora sp. NPDC052896 TaxID=3364061 RepID=UPI0037CA7AA2